MSIEEKRAAADKFYGERFGFERRTLGRKQAIEVVRTGWCAKATVKAIGEAFDAAVAAGEVAEAGKRTFSVAYHMTAGASAAGSSIGARPVSYDAFDAWSVRAWAERFAVGRLA